jgi:hypothetical protein
MSATVYTKHHNVVEIDISAKEIGEGACIEVTGYDADGVAVEHTFFCRTMNPEITFDNSDCYDPDLARSVFGITAECDDAYDRGARSKGMRLASEQIKTDNQAALDAFIFATLSARVAVTGWIDGLEFPVRGSCAASLLQCLDSTRWQDGRNVTTVLQASGVFDWLDGIEDGTVWDLVLLPWVAKRDDLSAAAIYRRLARLLVNLV